MAVRCLTCGIVDVAGVDVPLSVLHGDLPGAIEGSRGRGREIHHLVGRMERREMVGDVRTQMLDDPLGHLVDLLIRIVEAGDEQGCDLEPHVRLVTHILEGVEHRSERTGACPVIELLCETLEIDVRSVHVGVELSAWFGIHVPGGDSDRADPPLPGRVSDVDRVFVKDDRIVVGEGDARRAKFVSDPRHLLWTRFVGENVVLLRR